MFNSVLLALGLVLLRFWSALKQDRRRFELGAQGWREELWESLLTLWLSLLAQMWECWVSFTAFDHSEQKAFLKDWILDSITSFSYVI